MEFLALIRHQLVTGNKRGQGCSNGADRRAVPAGAGGRVVPVTRCLPGTARGVESRCKLKRPAAACYRPTAYRP